MRIEVPFPPLKQGEAHQLAWGAPAGSAELALGYTHSRMSSIWVIHF